MPLFFLDIDDGQRFIRDEEGLEFPSREAMGEAAMQLLPNIARDELPDRDRRTYRVSARDESGRPVFQATLCLASWWLD